MIEVKENKLYEKYIRNDTKGALEVLEEASYLDFIQTVHYIANKSFYDKYNKAFLHMLLTNRDLREEDIPMIDKLINKAIEQEKECQN